MKLDSATITGVIDRLERDGLIRRRSDPEDRRVHRIFLTKAGHELEVHLDRAMDELNEEADAVLGSDVESFKKALRQLGKWGSHSV